MPVISKTLTILLLLAIIMANKDDSKDKDEPEDIIAKFDFNKVSTSSDDLRDKSDNENSL